MQWSCLNPALFSTSSFGRTDFRIFHGLTSFNNSNYDWVPEEEEATERIESNEHETSSEEIYAKSPFEIMDSNPIEEKEQAEGNSSFANLIFNQKAGGKQGKASDKQRTQVSQKQIEESLAKYNQKVFSEAAPIWMKRSSGAVFGMNDRLFVFDAQKFEIKVQQPQAAQVEQQVQQVQQVQPATTTVMRSVVRVVEPKFEKLNLLEPEDSQYKFGFLADLEKVLLAPPKPEEEEKVLIQFLKDKTNSQKGKENEQKDEFWSWIEILMEKDEKKKKDFILNQLGFHPDEISKQIQSVGRADESISIEMPKISKDQSSMLLKTVVLGNFDEAVALCLKTKQYAEALILSACGGVGLWKKTRDLYLESVLAEKLAKQNNGEEIDEETVDSIKFTRLIVRGIRDLEASIAGESNLSLKKAWKNYIAVILSQIQQLQQQNPNNQQIGEYKKLINKLGDKLMENEEFDDAFMCFLAASNEESNFKLLLLLLKKTMLQNQGYIPIRSDFEEQNPELIERITFMYLLSANKQIPADSQQDLFKILFQVFYIAGQILGFGKSFKFANKFLSFASNCMKNCPQNFKSLQEKEFEFSTKRFMVLQNEANTKFPTPAPSPVSVPSSASSSTASSLGATPSTPVVNQPQITQQRPNFNAPQPQHPQPRPVPSFYNPMAPQTIPQAPQQVVAPIPAQTMPIQQKPALFTPNFGTPASVYIPQQQQQTNSFYQPQNTQQHQQQNLFSQPQQAALQQTPNSFFQPQTAQGAQQSQSNPLFMPQQTALPSPASDPEVQKILEMEKKRLEEIRAQKLKQANAPNLMEQFAERKELWDRYFNVFNYFQQNKIFSGTKGSVAEKNLELFNEYLKNCTDIPENIFKLFVDLISNLEKSNFPAALTAYDNLAGIQIEVKELRGFLKGMKFLCQPR